MIVCVLTTARGTVFGTTQRFPEVGGQNDVALIGGEVKAKLEASRHLHYAAYLTQGQLCGSRSSESRDMLIDLLNDTIENESGEDSIRCRS